MPQTEILHLPQQSLDQLQISTTHLPECPNRQGIVKKGDEKRFSETQDFPISLSETQAPFNSRKPILQISLQRSLFKEFSHPERKEIFFLIVTTAIERYGENIEITFDSLSLEESSEAAKLLELAERLRQNFGVWYS